MEDLHVRLLLSSDRAISVEFGNEISEKINRRIRVFSKLIEESGIPGISEIVPTYRAVMIHYEPETILYDELISRITALLESMHEIELPEAPTVRVPVCYGGKYGPDIEFVAKAHDITTEEVVRLHTAPKYLIYMLGFTPGFAYMGGMDERIATPRLETPRTSIPAGSVGIAGEQTGIYPIESPGGWQLIGRTPLILYHPFAQKRFLFEAGQHVCFYPVSEEEYEKISTEELERVSDL